MYTYIQIYLGKLDIRLCKLVNKLLIDQINIDNLLII